MESSPSGKGSMVRRAGIASAVGTTIEWYEFFIYGLAAAMVFGDLFFPAVDEHTGRLASFATLAVAFIARPLGAVIFGHLGDRVGRKATLIATLGITGSATGLIGLLPTYDSIGLWAPILLITLRLFQGLGVGGEWGGAVLMSVEHAPASKVRFYGSLPQIGAPLGLVLATAAMAAVSPLPDDQMLAWGWRIPFMIGFVLVGIGLIIRLGVEESNQFRTIRDSGETARLPIRDVFSRAKKGLTVGVGLMASVNVVFYIISVYLLSYASSSLGYSRNTILLVVMIAALIDCILLPFAAALSDRVGANRVFISGTVFTILASFPFFVLLQPDQVILMGVTITLMMLGAHVTTYSVVSSLIAEQFDTRIRYSGTSLAYAIGGLIFSAPTPFIAEALVGTGGDRWWPLSLMVLVTGVISLVAGFFILPSGRRRLRRLTAQPEPREANTLL